MVVSGPEAPDPALLPYLEAPSGAPVGLHLRHVFLHVSSFSTARKEARGTGVEAVSPQLTHGLVYQTVAYLRAALSLRSCAREGCSSAREASASLASFFGTITMTMLRPSRFGWLSMRPSSSRSPASLLRSLSPSSGCWTSRPRNMIVTFTLSPPRRKRSTWPRLVLKSWSPILGLSFISRTLTLTCFLRAALRACSSVATAHHSSRNRDYGAVRPPRTINLLVRRTDADPNYRRDYTAVPSLVSMHHYPRERTSRETASTKSTPAISCCCFSPRRRTLTLPSSASLSPTI